MKIRMIAGRIAGGAPRAVGEIVDLDRREAAVLVASGYATVDIGDEKPIAVIEVRDPIPASRDPEPIDQVVSPAPVESAEGFGAEKPRRGRPRKIQ